MKPFFANGNSTKKMLGLWIALGILSFTLLAGCINSGPKLRPDIYPPSFNMETVKFPMKHTFVSSGYNFPHREASSTYFGYDPKLHWGFYMFHNDKHNTWTKRYLFCTGWDSSTNALTLMAYSPSGEYEGEMTGTFIKQGDKYTYNCIFVNYRGRRTSYQMTEDPR